MGTAERTAPPELRGLPGVCHVQWRVHFAALTNHRCDPCLIPLLPERRIFLKPIWTSSFCHPMLCLDIHFMCFYIGDFPDGRLACFLPFKLAGGRTVCTIHPSDETFSCCKYEDTASGAWSCLNSITTSVNQICQSVWPHITFHDSLKSFHPLLYSHSQSCTSALFATLRYRPHLRTVNLFGLLL